METVLSCVNRFKMLLDISAREAFVAVRTVVRVDPLMTQDVTFEPTTAGEHGRAARECTAFLQQNE